VFPQHSPEVLGGQRQRRLRRNVRLAQPITLPHTHTHTHSNDATVQSKLRRRGTPCTKDSSDVRRDLLGHWLEQFDILHAQYIPDTQQMSGAML